MTLRIVFKFGLGLVLVVAIGGAAGKALAQSPNGKESAPGLKPDLKGKRIFEGRCATCHGLDGLGGEHAPDIILRPAVKTLSDQFLVNLIHDGIPAGGMPSFADMGKGDAHAVVAYIRSLQGKSAVGFVPGDPIRGKNLFVGKGGCSACHQIEGGDQFALGDLAGFARDHPADEVRDAILKPSGGRQEIATAVVRNGRKFSGMVRNEDNASLQLQDGDGRFYLLMKASLVSVERKTGDAMPVDYERRLSSAELDDLVSYIRREAHAPDLSSSPSREDKDKDNGKDAEPHAQD